LPQTDLNATGIPVFFKLPADQPESIPGNGDGIHWRLETSAKLRGPDFHASFEVPVFKLPEPPEISEDPTAQYQMSLDEVRRQIHSKIQVNDLPDGGKEFIFPAARNPGVAAGLTLIWLIFTSVFIVLIWQRAPVIFPIGCGVVALLIGIFAFNLWFLRSRVIVTPEQVTVQKSRLGIKTQRKVAATDITNISAQPGMTVGHSAYYDLKIHVRDDDDFAARKAKLIQTGQKPPMKFNASSPDGFTAGNNIAHKAEADWLVQQMIAGLKRPA
jgi:hypothetical protein